ncbi:pyruvate kinase [Candidatus Nomurabacteria bacterium]|nr:pyruvate kinase [Candidatus Nomurabacteria bacterium]
MTEKYKSPVSSLAAATRTKILATIGPATDDYEKVVAMIKNGVDGFRMNFSHGSYEERQRQIKWIRKASKELHVHVAIVQDIQGPKIRLGDFEGFIELTRGQELQLGYGVEHKLGGPIPVQYDLSKKVKRGDRLFMYDGKIKSVVTSVRDKMVSVRLENNGIITKRRGINLPDTDFTGDIITKKDREDLVFGSEQDIDWVAMSFVQTPDDIKELRRLLGNLKSDAKIITKVETKLAIDNLEGIVEASDGIIIARGDLAVETLPESVPVLQRKIIGLCLKHEKLSIVATQMMSSMMEEPEPTRAEVSDVATAVIVGADAVMLSDETATGRYPIESVAMMQRIILYTQNNSNVRAQFTDPHEYNVTEAIASVIIELALKVNATAIVAETQSGKTAQSISGWRPSLPILVVTPEARIAQQLALLYGSVCFVRPPHTHAATRLTDWLLEQKILKKGNKIVTASGKYSSVGGTDTIKVRVLE